MSISHATLQPLALRAGSTTVCASSSKVRRRSTAHCNGRTIDQTRAKAGASPLLSASGRDRCIQKATAHRIEHCNLWGNEEPFYGQSRWYMRRKPPLRPAPESADKSQRPTWRSGREKGRVLCTPSGDSDLPPLEEEEVALPVSEDVKDTVAIKLPGRRTLQIQFTCNSCGTRSTRLLNPFAFKRGTVFVQCAGCQKYHQLVDNLGLIKEYDFREERRQDGIAKDEDSGKVPPEGS